MCFENISLDKNYKSLSEYLDFCGYSKEDIELFFQKLKKEKNVRHFCLKAVISFSVYPR